MYTSEYPVFWVTVDLVLVTGQPGAREVLLIRRGHDPDAGAWAFPGGFVDPDEDLPEAARRELREETEVEVAALTQLGAYGAPGRDPRGRVVSVVYLAELAEAAVARAGDDAAEARWWPVAELLAESGVRLAFDHAQILRDAMVRVGE